jgi:hypothetical protein
MSRRRKFHLVVGAFVMGEFLHRLWMMATDGARPIDWVVVLVDFLVLVAILWFELPEWRHKRVVTRHKAKVIQFWSRGQQLQATAPSNQHPDNLPSWLVSVRNWNSEAQEFLQRCSPWALASFVHETSGALPPSAHVVVNQARESYRVLLVRLDNLKTIMDNPHEYL